MRAISWLALCFALLIQNPGAEGQNAARPGGPDPQAKKPEPRSVQMQIDGLQLQLAPQSGGGLDGAIDRLVKDLEDLRREMKKTKEPAKVVGLPRGEVRPMPGHPGASQVDQKLDMILQQMDEMRRDIKDLQKRLPTAKEKKGPPFEFKGFGAPKGPMFRDKKPGFPGAPPQPNDGDARPDVAVKKALQSLQERQRDEQRQKADNLMLKQHVERLLQEVEKLRNDLPKK